jgi:hypothetical protein
LRDIESTGSWQKLAEAGSAYLGAHPDMPEHFMGITKRYFTEVAPSVAPIPERAAITIDMIQKYHFGYMHHDALA